MAYHVNLAVLAATGDSVARFVQVFTSVYALVLVAYVLLAWVPSGASHTIEQIRSALGGVCEPYLRPFRRLIPPVGPLDLSPMVAVLALVIGGNVVAGLIESVS